MKTIKANFFSVLKFYVSEFFRRKKQSAELKNYTMDSISL